MSWANLRTSLFFFLAANLLAQAQVIVPGPASAVLHSTDPSSEVAITTISKRVDEVNLVFTVTDRKGRFIRDLTQQEVNVLDNHEPPQSVSYFQSQTDLPLKAALVIDLSDSISQRFDFEKKAAAIFLKNILRSESDAGIVIGFDSKVRLLQPLTSDKERLGAAVQSMLAGGETALYDAVVSACERLREADETNVSRRAIILVTDGADNRSLKTLEEAQDAALRSGVVIYAISTNPWSTPTLGDKVLNSMTLASGGRVLPGRSSKDVSHAFAKLEEELRSQYAMGYKPANLEKGSVLRKIELTSLRKKLRVHCRKEYYAGNRGLRY
jgi:VWFA-related protein